MAGRPRSFDRDAALLAAVEEFWRSGYDGSSIARLTAAMGITAPSLYAAFGDKQHLFDEASALYFDRAIAAVDDATALPTVEQAIARILDHTAHAHTGPTTPPGCLMLTEPRLGAQRETLRARLQDRLDQGIRDGDLAATVNSDQFAEFLVAVLRGMSGCARDGGSTQDLLNIADTAMTALRAVSAGAQAKHS